MQIVTFLFILAVMLQLFRKNPNKKKEEGKNYKKGGIEIWLRYAAFILAVPVSIYRQLATLRVSKFVINFKFIE